MTKLTLSNVGSLIDATTAQTTINANSDLIETAFDNTLSRDGTAPNTMNASIDMNSHQIINLPAASTANSPLRLQDLSTFIGGGTIASIPTDGAINQPLSKNSASNYDLKWNTTTGTGSAVLATSPTLSTPTLVSPVLGTPSSGNLANATNLPISTGVSGLGSSMSTFLATPSSANLRATLTDETGSGAAVFATSPTIATPVVSSPAVSTPTTTGGETLINIAAPAAPSVGNIVIYGDSTNNNLAAKTNAGSVYVTVLPASATSNQFVTNLGTNGALVTAQPSAANLSNSTTGSGAVALAANPTFTGTVSAATITSNNGITCTGAGAAGAIGFAAGAGGAVTQATNKATGVTLNRATGQITLNGAALAGDTTVSFVLTCNAIAATDMLIMNHISVGTFGSYLLNARAAAGSATIDVRNITTGSLSEAIVIQYAVFKGAIT